MFKGGDYVGQAILYLVLAGIISYIFKRIVGTVMGGPLLLLATVSNSSFEELFERNPRLFIAIGVFNHATAGALYALLIYAFSAYFVYVLGGNYWLYFVLSVIWAFIALGEASGMIDVFFFACVCGVPLLWFAGASFLLALWIILLLVFIPVYFKRNKLFIAMYKRIKRFNRYIPPDPDPIYKSEDWCQDNSQKAVEPKENQMG